MISLQAILKELNIPYLFSFYQDYHADLQKHEIYKFLDLNNIVTDKCLWNIAIENKWYAEDNAHPNILAHNEWSKIICQELKTKQIYNINVE
jgi:lysophospholipase L1-like esterase